MVIGYRRTRGPIRRCACSTPGAGSCWSTRCSGTPPATSTAPSSCSAGGLAADPGPRARRDLQRRVSDQGARLRVPCRELPVKHLPRLAGRPHRRQPQGDPAGLSRSPLVAAPPRVLPGGSSPFVTSEQATSAAVPAADRSREGTSAPVRELTGLGIETLAIAPTSFFGDYGCHVRILEEVSALRGRGVRTTLVTYPFGRDLPDLPIHRSLRLPGHQHVSPAPRPRSFRWTPAWRPRPSASPPAFDHTWYMAICTKERRLAGQGVGRSRASSAGFPGQYDLRDDRPRLSSPDGVGYIVSFGQPRSGLCVMWMPS